MTNDIIATGLAAEIISCLSDLGYSKSLLQENYAFADWFTDSNEERRLTVAAFGQTPISYDSALIGVTVGNGVLKGPPLVNRFRALGAPVLLEIDGKEVREWAVSRNEREHLLIETYPADKVQQLFIDRASHWEPEAFLRAKNIGSFSWQRQFGLFDGLLPELESQIQSKLDPLLREALSSTSNIYTQTAGVNPKPEILFQLIFWLLTAKVFSDRHVPGFETLSPQDPDELLRAVAEHYKEQPPKLLNRLARTVAASTIWKNLDFRNLSVDVLSQIWSTTLVDQDTRKRLGIYRTSRSIVRYIVERTPLAVTGDDARIVFEPCCGSASFLIGAMGYLRQRLFGMTPKERHAYFVKHLSGIEQEPFGIEISKFALTLADFPNSDGWSVQPGDVFLEGTMRQSLRRSGVVFCNPPFEEFTDEQRQRYKLTSALKPAELLNRILADLHSSGVLGFVLPRLFIDGRMYATIRQALAKRFAVLELTTLPDRAFEDADSETVLLIASQQIPHHSTRVTVRRVNDDPVAWQNFERRHQISSEHSANFTASQARESLLVPDLPNVWQYLDGHKQLREHVKSIKRGLRWQQAMIVDRQETGKRQDYERSTEEQGFIRGVASNTKFSMFEVPTLKFLSIRPEDRATNAWMLPWHLPKVIFGKSAKSRGHWRLAAFPDSDGIACYQTYIAVWPKESGYDEVVLAAILNSPVANAFISSREGKTDITIETIGAIPMPVLNSAQRSLIRGLVARYQDAIGGSILDAGLTREDPERLLKEIDAAVLDGYRLPPRVEMELLEFFRGHQRPTKYPFGDYLPKDTDVAFSLSRLLRPNQGGLTARDLLNKTYHH